MLIKMDLEKYLENAKTSEPYPGGGSVAAYVGALGAALNIMVAELSYGKKQYEGLPEETKKEITDGHEKLNEYIERLKPLVDEDSSSFTAVLEAFKMPKETDEEKAARSKAIQDGYVIALKVPLETATVCVDAMNLLEAFAKNGSAHAITDVGCGVLFLAAAAEGALFNVYINLQAIKDEEKRVSYKKEADELKEKARTMRDAYLDIVYDRL